MAKKFEHTAVIIDDVVISGELLDEHFVCDLSKCKGACCVAGDLGAPLEKTELAILEEIYPQVEPYLTEEGKLAIAKEGKYVYDFTKKYSTPLIDGGACAYTIFEKGIAFCGIEKAQREGKIDFLKPISCHLYPIRVKKMKTMELLNYDEWDICEPACACGVANKVRVYQFLKTALIRRYGEAFYQQLDESVKNHEAENKP